MDYTAEIDNAERKWKGLNQFTALADELNAVGAHAEAAIAATLATQYPDADIVAYHSGQATGNCWNGFMLNKLRQYKGVRGPLTIKIMEMMGL